MRTRLKEGFVPDLQVPFRIKSARFPWDDSEYFTLILSVSYKYGFVIPIEVSEEIE